MSGARAAGPRRIRSAPGPALLRIATGVATGLALGLAPTAAADPPPTQRPAERLDAAAERPVATPPDGGTASDGRVGTGGTAGMDADSPPLTRAAERRRIESITPSTWLAGFGPISVQRSE